MTRTAMTRDGSSLLVVIIILGISIMLLMSDVAGHARRLSDAGARTRRVAARELALGAMALQPGQVIRIGAWRIERGAGAGPGDGDGGGGDSAGRYQASGPTGVYVIDGGRDQWVPTRGEGLSHVH